MTTDPPHVISHDPQKPVSRPTRQARFASDARFYLRRIFASMSHADWEEPPPKKRRFFVEDPIDDASLQTESTLPDEVNALPEAPVSTDGDEATATVGGFDEELFAGIVGDHQLPPSSLRRLRDLSGDDLERGL